MQSLQSIHITGIGYYVPQTTVTNTDLSLRIDTSDAWIYSHTGIRERRIAQSEELCSDLAVQAALDLFSKHKGARESIDGIIVATATPDHYGFPSTACIIAEKLGLKGCAAFDLAAGCTGFIYALDVAKAMIQSGSMQKVLVFGSEKLSRVVDWEDRNTCVLFGDGAGCVVVEQTTEVGGILDSVLHSPGTGSHSLAISQENNTITMEGRAVYTFAVEAIGETILELLKRNNLTFPDLAWVVPHQANARIITACSKRYGFESERFFLNIDRYANTSAASIPIALAEMEDQNLLKKGQLILFVGFGAGLTYGGTLIQW